MFSTTVKGFLVLWYEMSLADEGFSFGLEVMSAAEVDGANLDGGLKAGSR